MVDILFVDTPICRFLFRAVMSGFRSLYSLVSVAAAVPLAKSLLPYGLSLGDDPGFRNICVMTVNVCDTVYGGSPEKLDSGCI